MFEFKGLKNDKEPGIKFTQPPIRANEDTFPNEWLYYYYLHSKQMLL